MYYLFSFFVGWQAMNELGEEASEGSWRYCEHPLSAVTTAMLNINSSEEQQQHVTLLYDYYKPEG